MARTVNFTGAVDPVLLPRAKVVAAKAQTSINAELRCLVETFEAGEASGNQDFRALFAFSPGRSDEPSTLRALGIDSAEDLFLLMVQAHLPMPRRPDAITRTRGDSLRDLPAWVPAKSCRPRRDLAARRPTQSANPPQPAHLSRPHPAIPRW
jgi:hypothetical protein